ncbi:MAG: hypothetical protein ACP6IY_17545 [Promethearchaeia archaeon]
MGLIILATCKCGFKKEFQADRDKIVKKWTCLAPALCKKCKKMIIVNYAEKSAKCPECGEFLIFYNNPSLQKKSSKGKDALSWGMDIKKNFILPKTSYYCPNCEEMNLHFKKIGHWD